VTSGPAAFTRIDVLFLVSPFIPAFLAVVALERGLSRPRSSCLAGFAFLTAYAVEPARAIEQGRWILSDPLEAPPPFLEAHARGHAPATRWG